MKLTGITYSRYNYSFKNLITTSKTILNRRQGFIIKLITDDEHISIGESAPLPHFGSENFNEADNCLREITTNLSNISLPDNFEEVSHWLEQYTLTPTVRFAFEQALFEFILVRDTNLQEIKNDVRIPVNALLHFSSQEEILQQLEYILGNGFSTIKLKAGVKSFNEELETLRRIALEYPQVKIKLDINGAWEKAKAVKNLHQLNHLNIEYVEQPVEKTSDLIYVSEQSEIPIAADESIRSVQDALQIIEDGSIKYLVLKPMLLGGYFKTKEILEAAKDKCKVIISSSLETNLGRRFLVFIASQTSETITHGLATTNLYIDDPVKDIFPLENGFINFSLDNYSRELSKNLS